MDKRNIYKKCGLIDSRTRLIIIFLLNIAFFIICSYLMPIRYEENDDIGMCMIANGMASGTPDCHLVFINAIWGSLLALLYSLTGCVEWYTLLFAAVHIASMTAIAYMVLRSELCTWWMKSFYLLFFYVIWVRIIVSFQFTTTAALSCIAGCMLISAKKKSFYVWGIIHIFVASLIRFSAAGLVALMFAPLYLYSIGRQWKQYVYLATLAISVTVLHLSDNLFYQSDGWKAYKEYNDIRGIVNDNPNADEIKESLPRGISKNDYHMLCCFFGDPSVMNKDVMKDIGEKLGGWKLRIKY